MTTSNKQLIRTLQREQIRLMQENEFQQQQVEQLQDYVELMADLYWAVRQLGKIENSLKYLDALLLRTIEALKARDGSIAMIDPETNELVFLIVQGGVRNQLTGFRMAADAGIAGWVLDENKPVIVDNPRQDWRFSMRVDEKFSFATRSIMCLPIYRQNQPAGVLNLLNKRKGQSFSKADLTLAAVLSDIAGLTLSQAALQTEMPVAADEQVSA